MSTIAVLLLAGGSTRFESPTPKTLYPVAGKEMFLYSFETLSNSPLVDKILLVTNDSIRNSVVALANSSKLIGIIDGGETREHSVKNAIDYLKDNYSDNVNVLICDGDRPNLSNEIIERNVNALKSNVGCVTAVKAIDSIFEVGETNKIKYLERSHLYNAQTPQSFRLGVLIDSFLNINPANYTDDSSVVIEKGYNIVVVEGSYKNYKITTIEDIKKFEEELK